MKRIECGQIVDCKIIQSLLLNCEVVAVNFSGTDSAEVASTDLTMVANVELLGVEWKDD